MFSRGPLLALLLTARVFAAEPQRAELSGRVQSLGTREPLAAATVTVDNVQVETDAFGQFVISLSPGSAYVRVTASGHAPRDFEEKLEPGQRLEVVYRLDPTQAPRYQTTVRDTRARTEVARVVLNKAETKETAGTMGEPLRAVMQLPGVSSVVSGLAYPVVRGTQPAASAYYLDGIRIPQLFHALAGPSVVHPDFIDRVDFFPGVAPARFGRLLGGAIEATSAKPLDRFSISGSLDLINASAFALVPIEKTGTSFTLAARGSYTPLIGARLASFFIPADPGQPETKIVANFYDYQARIEQKLGKGRLRLLAFGASDEAGTEPNGADVLSGVFSSLFHRVDLLWQGPLGKGTFEAGATFGRDISGVHGEQQGRRAFELSMARWLGGGRLAYSIQFSDSLAVRAGADVEVQLTSTNVRGITGRDDGTMLVQKQTDGVIGGAYVQARHLAGGFETVVGLRADVFNQLSGPRWVSIEPRLEERLVLNDVLAVRAAAGLFHQPPTYSLAFPVTDVGLLDEGLQWAAHSELGADVSLPLGLELGITGFYNPLFRTVEHPITELLFPAGRSVVRSGVAYGGEIFLRRQATGRWFGWLSATLQRSERLTEVIRYGENAQVIGSALVSIPSAFDQTFVLHAVLGVKLPWGLSAGASIHVNTGRPESGEVSSRTQRGERDAVTGARYWSPRDLDQVDRLPSFFRIDARISKLWSFDDWQLEAYLDVMNASLSREVLAYDYRVVNNQLQRSPIDLPVVLPMLGVKGKY